MSSPTLQIIPCGTKITISLGLIPGVISEIIIKYDRILYNISYLYNGEGRIVTLHEKEFTIGEAEKQNVGFSHPPQP